MRKSWMSLIITFALGVTVGLAVGYSKPHSSAEAPIELFTGQSVVVIQPVGPPGSKQYAERRLRIVRIRPLQQDRTPGDNQFGSEFTGWRLIFWTTSDGAVAFADPE